MNLFANKEMKKARENIFSLAFWLFIICYILSISALISACQSENHFVLEIVQKDNMDKVLSIKVEPEEIFYLEFRNSRDLNPIIDKFKIGTDGSFYLVEERYPWFGVGQECHPSRDITHEDGMVVVKLNKKLEKLPLRVAYTVDQILKVKNKNYLIGSIAEKGKAIEICISIKGG